jgi:signal transduction histidine kinase
LRTPLTSIRGFAELMERRIEQPKFREMAGLIRKAFRTPQLPADRDPRPDQGGGRRHAAEPGAPGPAGADRPQRASFFQVSASEKQLELSARFDASVPATWVCDGLRLKQILNNLLSNAIKFTPAGSVRIELEVASRQLRVHVVDSGAGIPPDMQEKVFERFRQGSDRVSYQHGGTGLGLALARALAERMGGSLTLQSIA